MDKDTFDRMQELPIYKSTFPNVDWDKIDQQNNRRFWIPVIISLVALGVSIWSLTIQVQDREVKRQEPSQTDTPPSKKAYLNQTS